MASILLVEDDRLVRDTVQRLLDRLGHTVIAAESPAEALGYCRESDAHIDLLVTDYTLPKMNGVELGKQLRERRPACRVLVISGYGASPDIASAAATTFLAKPFTPDGLAAAVDAALRG